ncbi:MAG: Fur family transcriptional regulator, peroxide stress response regulator [Solirubrobacterales bacterium]|jgi:Fe2+ or Zn2+ uptake regulation protein|nr:Fur family transcriptional regulator, peroxide stress response regulator [Solirubrobacterales bacterium]
MPRPSPVRDRIAELVGAGDRHDWSIEDLLEALSGRDVDANFSTVFRAVARLEEDGAIRRVELGDGKARYEAVGEHHEHVRCRECGAVAAVPGCVVDAAVPRVQDLTGFRVTGHQILFEGTCPKCS